MIGKMDTVEEEKGLKGTVLKSVSLFSIVPALVLAISKYASIAGRRTVLIIGMFRTQGAKECSQQYCKQVHSSFIFTLRITKCNKCQKWMRENSAQKSQ